MELQNDIGTVEDVQVVLSRLAARAVIVHRLADPAIEDVVLIINDRRVDRVGVGGALRDPRQPVAVVPLVLRDVRVA